MRISPWAFTTMSLASLLVSIWTSSSETSPSACVMVRPPSRIFARTPSAAVPSWVMTTLPGSLTETSTEFTRRFNTGAVPAVTNSRFARISWLELTLPDAARTTSANRLAVSVVTTIFT